MGPLPAALAACLVLAGCAREPLTQDDADRAAVRAAVVVSVAKPEAAYYVGPGGGAGFTHGARGVIATESGLEAARDTQRFLQTSGIPIERIVQEEFGTALRASGKLKVVERAEAGAGTLRIAIRQYGLSIPNGAGRTLAPVLALTCELVDASGRTVWRASDRVLEAGSPVSEPDVYRNPRAVEAALRAAARKASAVLLRTL
jgi:hypothetical protein